MKLDLDKIERDAREATSGRWYWDDDSDLCSEQTASSVSVAFPLAGRIDITEHDARHIANCSPDVVLAMVARIRELEQRLDDIRDEAFERDLLG